jgi:hypothetical protein
MIMSPGKYHFAKKEVKKRKAQHSYIIYVCPMCIDREKTVPYERDELYGYCAECDIVFMGRILYDLMPKYGDWMVMTS